jgi:hypothetical protein
LSFLFFERERGRKPQGDGQVKFCKHKVDSASRLTIARLSQPGVCGVATPSDGRLSHFAVIGKMGNNTFGLQWINIIKDKIDKD